MTTPASTPLENWESNGGAPQASEEPDLQAGDAPAANPTLAARWAMPNAVGMCSPPTSPSTRRPVSSRRSPISPRSTAAARSGARRATPEQIRKDFHRWPDANIGIPTGAENGIFVVETDTKEGHDVDGDAALAELEQQHGKLPDTLMAESPSGSKHRYFKHPGDGIKIMNSASMLGPGIDVRVTAAW